MKDRAKRLTIILSCFVMVLFVCRVLTLGAESRPTISDAERALATIQVQNTFSKHAYYHAAGLHAEEMADIWVKEDGPYAATVSWTNNDGIQEGMALVKKNYVIDQIEGKKELLARLSKIYPELKNVPENIGAGYEYAIHTQTTPIIEIAGDGKTAKGIWYSPGILLAAVINEDEGRADLRGGWFWEKYGVDFVKEDGKWKIWHIQMCYDPTPPGWGAERQALSQGQQEQGDQNRSQDARPNPNPYQAWSPTTVPKIQPRFPEPYYTFSETFSY